MVAVVMVAVTTVLDAGSVRASPAWAQQPGDAAALQERAERLVGQPYPPYPGASGQAQTVQLLPGELPHDLPVSIPVPPGGRLVGSAVRRADAQTTGTEIVIDAPGTAAQVAAFYEQALREQGWTSPQSSPGPIGGFEARPPVSSSTCCHAEGSWALNLLTFPQTSARCAGRLVGSPTARVGARRRLPLGWRWAPHCQGAPRRRAYCCSHRRAQGLVGAPAAGSARRPPRRTAA